MIYLGKGGHIPYLDKSKIKAEVDDVLGECWNGEFPVNVEEICDELNLGILPIPNLNKSFYIDAYISADFKNHEKTLYFTLMHTLFSMVQKLSLSGRMLAMNDIIDGKEQLEMLAKLLTKGIKS